MRIAYCTNVRLPTERAHGHQIARVTDALSKLGHKVTIFAPHRKNNPIIEDYWAFHHAAREVTLKQVGNFDPIDSWIPKVFQLPILNGQLKRKLKNELTGFDVLYTRTPALLPTLLSTTIPVVAELHTLPNRNRGAFVQQCNQCALVVCLTSPMKNELVSWGVETKRVIVESDAVSLERFSHVIPMQSGLPHPRIGYAGQLESMGLSKGIPEFLAALSILRREKASCIGVIAGPHSGNSSLEAQLAKAARQKDIHYMGFLANSAVPGFLASCDVLVYPAPASDHPFYNRDTSPLKIFEYMAAGKPIVTADLPPIRDVLDESMATFCKPGDAADLAQAIAEVLAHMPEAQQKAQKAKETVVRYTWEERMRRILKRVTMASSL